MMQRSSSSMARNVIIGCVSIILLLAVLYYMKRVEVKRLKGDVDNIALQGGDREDVLNRKLTEYLQKLEDMTRQLGDINSRLQECEDNKATVLMEVQKCKSIHGECLGSKEAAESSLKAAQSELGKVKAQHETVNSQLNSHHQDLANVQHSLADAERELQQCEDEKDTCTNNLRESSSHVQECQQREAACQASLRAGGQQSFNRGPSANLNPGLNPANGMPQLRSQLPGNPQPGNPQPGNPQPHAPDNQANVFGGDVRRPVPGSNFEENKRQALSPEVENVDRPHEGKDQNDEDGGLDRGLDGGLDGELDRNQEEQLRDIIEDVNAEEGNDGGGNDGGGTDLHEDANHQEGDYNAHGQDRNIS